jgi:CRP/FNR family transcriptional regulator, anaerobic regulatory protein
MLTKYTAGSAPDNLLFSVGFSAFDLNFWHALLEISKMRARDEAPMLSSIEHSIPPNTTICHPTDWHDSVPVICSGWAMACVPLANGRQQILSFLLPGEIASTALVFGPTAGRLVQSITNVTYRSFNRAELKAAMLKHPELLEKFSKVWIAEKLDSDQLCVDLGRRTGDERLARLILKLTKKLANRGMVRGQAFEFPLRQHQIADATGLTLVHINRVLVSFRRKGLIELDSRKLTILNADELYRIASLT